MKLSPAQALKQPPRSSFMRAVLNVCACEACCQIQPWRREVVARHKTGLKASRAMRGKWREKR